MCQNETIRQLRKMQSEFKQTFGVKSYRIEDAIMDIEDLIASRRAKEKERSAKSFLSHIKENLYDEGIIIQQLPEFKMTLLYTVHPVSNRRVISAVAKCSPHDRFSPVVGKAICIARHLGMSTRKFE